MSSRMTEIQRLSPLQYLSLILIGITVGANANANVDAEENLSSVCSGRLMSPRPLPWKSTA